MSNVNERKVTVAARVPLDLATELGRMAEAGNRTVSREIWAAVAEHVAQQLPGVVSVPPFERPETDERRGLVAPAPIGFAGLSGASRERLEKLQRLEREGDQAVR